MGLKFFLPRASLYLSAVECYSLEEVRKRNIDETDKSFLVDVDEV